MDYVDTCACIHIYINMYVSICLKYMSMFASQIVSGLAGSSPRIGHQECIAESPKNVSLHISSILAGAGVNLIFPMIKHIMI